MNVAPERNTSTTKFGFVPAGGVFRPADGALHWVKFSREISPAAANAIRLCDGVIGWFHSDRAVFYYPDAEVDVGSSAPMR